MAAILRHVMLLQRDVPKAATFYSEGLGLRLLVCTKQWAELECGPGARLALKGVEGEAFVTTGYTPFLSFQVTDMDERLTRMISLGAVMDGAVKFSPTSRSAVLRAPDGHMIGLVERDEKASER